MDDKNTEYWRKLLDKDDKNLRDWEKFLDAEKVKESLILSSLYLFSYEMLKSCVVDRIKDFYTNGFDQNGDIVSQDYHDHITSRKINGRQHVFLSSLHWLQEHGAITKDDVKDISELRELRNKVAHQINKFISDSDVNITPDRIDTIFKFIKLIDKWWIVNVEIPIDLDSNDEEIDLDGIISGNEIIYTYIKGIAEEIINKKS